MLTHTHTRLNIFSEVCNVSILEETGMQQPTWRNTELQRIKREAKLTTQRDRKTVSRLWTVKEKEAGQKSPYTKITRES